MFKANITNFRDTGSGFSPVTITEKGTKSEVTSAISAALANYVTEGMNRGSVQIIIREESDND